MEHFQDRRPGESGDYQRRGPPEGSYRRDYHDGASKGVVLIFVFISQLIFNIL